MIELRNITKIYNSNTVSETRLFEGLSLTVGDGEFISVVGSNGSGKTTLLNLVCGSTPLTGGEVLLDGKNIGKLREFERCRRIGRVHQDPAAGTCPHMTIWENLSMADNKGKPYGLSPGLNRARRETYRSMLHELGLGLEDKLEVPVGLLSGGQRQAVALLMATLTPVDFLILDEHTAALDPHTADIIMQLTDRVVREKGLTALMVTHNLRYAVDYGTRLLMMDRGRIILDRSGEEKKSMTVDDVLALFNAISIECGN